MPRFGQEYIVLFCTVWGQGSQRGSVRIILYYSVPCTFTTGLNRTPGSACIAIFQFQKQFCSANIRVVKDKLCKYI